MENNSSDGTPTGGSPGTMARNPASEPAAGTRPTFAFDFRPVAAERGRSLIPKPSFHERTAAEESPGRAPAVLTPRTPKRKMSLSSISDEETKDKVRAHVAFRAEVEARVRSQRQGLSHFQPVVRPAAHYGGFDPEMAAANELAAGKLRRTKGFYEPSVGTAIRMEPNSDDDVFANAFPKPKKGKTMADSVRDSALIVIEISTNVIIDDEFGFVRDLSGDLAQAFQCPAASICLSVKHSVCMMVSGNHDPAYIMTVSSLESSMSGPKNSDHAVVLQAIMSAKIPSIHPMRGIIKFVGLGDANLAWDGRTSASRIADAERATRIASKRSKKQHSDAAEVADRASQSGRELRAALELGMADRRRDFPVILRPHQAAAYTADNKVGLAEMLPADDQVGEAERRQEKGRLRNRKSIVASFLASKFHNARSEKD